MLLWSKRTRWRLCRHTHQTLSCNLLFMFQAVPVPVDTVQEIKDTFMQCAEAESFELFEIPKHSDLKQVSCCFRG